MTSPRSDLRILQVAREIRPGFGVSGPAWELERRFQRLGYRCERFTLEDVCSISAESPSSASRNGLFRFWRDVVVFSVWGSFRLWRRLRRDPDPNLMVLCHVDALVGEVFVLRSLHKAYLARSGGTWFRVLRNPLHAFILLRDWVRFRFRTHRHIVALSEANADELVYLYGVDRSAMTVIPNGVDTERFRPSPDERQAMRRELGIPAAAFVLSFVANEFERKGLRVLLDAIALLQGQGIDVELLVAGADSPDQFRVAGSAVADRVHYLGYRADVERIYAAADAFVLPTCHELSPLVGLEALASGLPVLITPVGGAREYLADGETGYFIDGSEDIAEKVRRWTENPMELERMSVRARAAAEVYDWSEIAGRYAELFDRLLARRDS